MPADEFSLIARYFSSLGAGPAVVLGVGDDCALLQLAPGERLATSVDTALEGVHFPADSLPEDVAYRAVAAAASDLAAMGARPLGMTLALTLPAADELWLHSFSQGLAAAASELSLPLVGGDTTRGPLTITVQVLGALPPGRALTRDAARPGDSLYVSGTLGDAAAGLAVLQGRYRPELEVAEYLEGRFFRPTARLQLGASLLHDATAAIDLSDGLLADAGHIAAASGVQLRIDAHALPLSAALQAHPDRAQALAWALAGGDDYELCFCLPAGASPPAGCTRIGEVAAGAGVVCPGFEHLATGYRHF
ncbi:MAG: thiamine-phosphate kinase [Haliea sp.]|uniref:thiamine-phosphate kinase n=1 Tax=Haliea sp. TaxID=1932666 RepID=UPI000C51B4C0|nr:thiamine-phosphate kinase [Haliea sp.]MBM70901.1 thiamine-phosphate kinase [Haliea sp.]|tara:strand:- start:34367 stop:35287 length:921 start_codon:yes stop_codon:yes gene_type:complete